MNRGSFFWKCALMGFVGLLLIGFVTMLLWNWLVPDLFGGPVISYLQALGLLVLSKILTWGLWAKGSGQHYAKHQFKQRFQEKLSSIDPAEREAFKQKMKEKWCRWEQEASGNDKPSNI